MKLGWMLMLAGVALAGCRGGGGGDCGLPPEYNNSVNLPPLKVPAGYSIPDTKSALKIPPVDAPEVPRSATQPCLDYPPQVVPPAAPPKPQA
jgi:uncharacterized lipoprotein